MKALEGGAGLQDLRGWVLRPGGRGDEGLEPCLPVGLFADGDLPVPGELFAGLRQLGETGGSRRALLLDSGDVGPLDADGLVESGATVGGGLFGVDCGDGIGVGLGGVSSGPSVCPWALR